MTTSRLFRVHTRSFDYGAFWATTIERHRMTNTASLISAGLVQPLHEIPFHGNGVAPLLRRVLAGPAVHPELEKHIVAHEIQAVSAAKRFYSEPHVHDCAEINVLLSLTRLAFEIRLGADVYIVEAPATIYIPAGLLHSANVIEGSGFYLAVLDTADYAASASPAGFRGEQ